MLTPLRRRITTVALVVVSLIGGASEIASAQNVNALKGIDTLGDLVIETLSPDAQRCGITPAGIDAAMRVTLDPSRLRIASSNTAAFPWLYARVSVIRRADGSCVAAVDLSLHRIVTIPATGDLVAAQVWDSGSLLTGGQVDFESRIPAQIRSLTQEFLAAWIKANPK